MDTTCDICQQYTSCSVDGAEAICFECETAIEASQEALLRAIQAQMEEDAEAEATKEAFKDKLRSIGFVRIPRAAK